MRITFLGTCSGTEPRPGYRHVSFTIEYDGGVYWFDAGEGCSYTAHLAGIDLLAVRAIFITHTDMDHVGGLPNLLWTMRKINGISRDRADRLTGKTVRIFIPDLAVWEGVLGLLGGTEGGFEIDYKLDAQSFGDGVIHDADGLRVEALHNCHLGEPDEGRPWQSFSFRIEAGGRSVVYSGDVRHVNELVPILDGCDLVLMETGHHDPADVCRYLKDTNSRFGRLGFIHHGRHILDDRAGVAATVDEILPKRVFIADDGMTVEL